MDSRFKLVLLNILAYILGLLQGAFDNIFLTYTILILAFSFGFFSNKLVSWIKKEDKNEETTKRINTI